MAKILLVEDEFIVLDVLKQFLENEEHDVFVATTGKEMFYILADQKGGIDLVLLDLTLPDMNGIELLPKLIDEYSSLKLVIIFLNRIENLEELLTAFVEIGVSGATVLDSVGMGRIIAENVPIFAGLSEAFPGSSPSNKTIFTVVKEELVEEMCTVIREVVDGFDEPGSGMLITLPVETVYGFKTHLD